MRDQLRKQTEKRNLEENLQGNMKYFMAIGTVSKLFNELEFDTPCMYWSSLYSELNHLLFFGPLMGQ